jgi:hypothetical protein
MASREAGTVSMKWVDARASKLQNWICGVLVSEDSDLGRKPPSLPRPAPQPQSSMTSVYQSYGSVYEHIICIMLLSTYVQLIALLPRLIEQQKTTDRMYTGGDPWQASTLSMNPSCPSECFIEARLQPCFPSGLESGLEGNSQELWSPREEMTTVTYKCERR